MGNSTEATRTLFSMGSLVSRRLVRVKLQRHRGRTGLDKFRVKGGFALESMPSLKNRIDERDKARKDEEDKKVSNYLTN